MPAAEYFGVVPLSALSWPVSWRYWLQTPWGDARMEMAAEAADYVNEPGKSAALGVQLWRTFLAPVAVRDVRLDIVETVCWKNSPIPGVTPVQNANGTISGPASSKAATPTLQLRTADTDDLSRRLVCLPGAPAAWVADRRLTSGARLALENWGNVLGMATRNGVLGVSVKLLLVYNELLPPEVGNVTGVAFRFVDRIRCLEYTSRHPDLSQRPWP